MRLIAFYLPQVPPDPREQPLWGRGFTEWSNVTRARPLFHGHHQPHVPADLGFYDLRLPETHLAKAELARLCEPKRPFCLAWANETWSRRWLGKDIS
jgi:Glycosyltransferase WbsX